MTERQRCAWYAIALFTATFLTVALENSSRADESSSLAQAPSIAAIHEQMQEFVDADKLAGAVTLVAKDGHVVHLDAVGWADLDAKEPMKTDSLFSIASMTKPMASAAALILCDEGKLSLDEPIGKWLPEFDTDRYRTVTLRDLLTHTSGLGGNQQNTGTLAETVKEIATRQPKFKPGEAWQYSPGISVAGRLVEVASGKPLDVFMKERLFEPLGMKDTTFLPTDDQEKRIAKIYKPGDNDTGLVVSENWFLGPRETRTPNPSGGLFSTAEDINRFYQMLLNNGRVGDKQILSEKIVKEMRTPQTGDLKAGFVPGSAWGLGVGIVTEPVGVTEMLSPGTFGHGGLYGTQSWADPETKTVYIMLIQRLGLLNGDASPYRKAFQEIAAEAVNK